MEKELSLADELAKLHPVAQVAIPLIIGATLCFAIYQLYKTIRER
jgi:hypothetical protein